MNEEQLVEVVESPEVEPTVESTIPAEPAQAEGALLGAPKQIEATPDDKKVPSA